MRRSRSRSRRVPNRSNSRSRQSSNIFRMDDIGYSTDIDELLTRSNSHCIPSPIRGLSPIRIPSPSLSPTPIRTPTPIFLPAPILPPIRSPAPIRIRSPNPIRTPQSVLSVDWSEYEEDYNINNELFKLYSDNLFNYLATFKIHFEQQLGRGANGTVYKATIQEDDDDVKEASSRPREVVIKIMKKNMNSRYEYEIQKLFYDKGVLVPEPIWYGEFEDGKNIEQAIIIMDLNSFASEMGTFSNWLNVKQPEQILDYMLKSIDLILEDLCAHNFVHGDLHWGNIAFQSTYENLYNIREDAKFTMSDKRGNIVTVAPLLIDFGLASSGVRCFPVLEIVQLLRTLYMRLRTRNPCDIDNKDYLVNGLIELLLKYSPNLPNLIDIDRLSNPHYVESLYEKLLVTYYLPVYKVKVNRWEKGLPDKVVRLSQKHF